MSLDLSGLDKFSSLMGGDDAQGETGKPLLISLKNLIEDPDQPRKHFDEASLKELAANIKARGVKTPISIRTNPENPDQYIINHGARRYRAAALAGLKEMPAWLDDGHEFIDQLTENLQRDNLTLKDTIAAVHRLKQQGMTQPEISRQIGKTQPWVSRYLAIADLPECLAVFVETDRCNSAKVLESAKRLWKKNQEQTEGFLETVEQLAAPELRQLEALLNGPAETPSGPPGEAAGDHTPANPQASENTPDNEASKPAKKPIDPDRPDKTSKFRKPVIKVRVGRKDAILIHGVRPESGPGWLRVQYPDGTEEEVEAPVKITAIEEGAP